MPAPPSAPPALPGYMPMPAQYASANPAQHMQALAPMPAQPQFAQTPYIAPAQPPMQSVQADVPPVISMPPAPIQPPTQSPVNSVTHSLDDPLKKDDPVVEISSDTPSENEEQIDQEWVTRARETIEKTHADPYQESVQLSQIKAEYLKARYNKSVKVQK